MIMIISFLLGFIGGMWLATYLIDKHIKEHKNER